MCSVNSLGETLRPASSSATFKPASARRLAAHPPVAPEPTTTASKVWERSRSATFFGLRFAAGPLAVRCFAVPSQRFHASLGNVKHARDPAFQIGEVRVADLVAGLAFIPRLQRIRVREKVQQFELHFFAYPNSLRSEE